MKKIIICLFLLLVAAAAGVIYAYAPARAVALSLYEQYVAPQVARLCPAETAAPAPAVPAVAEPAPVVEPAPEPAPAPASAPAPEPVVEEPAPLPALNAEAEALLPKAEAGDAVAQFNLARQYVLGEGMAMNRDEFVRWCGTAAEQGLPEAQFTMGCCYRDGLWVEKDEARGIQLLKQAAEAGFAPAAAALSL